MTKFLTKRFGQPESFTAREFQNKPPGSGIVILKIPFPDTRGHADLWDGSKLIDGHDDFIGRATNILYWKLEK